MLQDSRHIVRFIAPTHKPFVQNLHLTVHDFLEQGHDFLLLVDDDNPPLENPLDLVDLDLDVVGLPTPIWHNDTPGGRPYLTNVWKQRPNTVLEDGIHSLDSTQGFEGKGLYEVDVVGTGCILIARRVLLELMRRCEGDPMNTPFMRKWNDKGLVEMGNDFSFCLRAKEAGFRIWANYDYMCEHINEVGIGEVVNAFGSMNRG